MDSVWRTRTLVGACLAVALGAVTSCGNSSQDAGGSGTSGAQAQPSLVQLVPKDIRSKGWISGGSNFNGRPLDHYSSGTKPDGVLIDILAGAAARMGLKIRWTQISYSGLIPALQSGRIDIAGAQISPTPASKDVVNFLAFYKGSSSLLVRKGTSYKTNTDACGTRFALTAGSILDKTTADGINKQCAAAGKPGLKDQGYPSLSAAEVALRAGRIDSFLFGTPQSLYAAKADPRLAVTLSGQLGIRDTGVALAKKNPELTKAFKASINSMIADGEYAKILAKWDLSTIAIDRAEINDEIKSSK